MDGVNAASNIVFTSGLYDPWSSGGVGVKEAAAAKDRVASFGIDGTVKAVVLDHGVRSCSPTPPLPGSILFNNSLLTCECGFSTGMTLTMATTMHSVKLAGASLGLDVLQSGRHTRCAQR